MPAIVETLIADALCGRRRPLIWNHGRSAIVTAKDITLLQKLAGMFGSSHVGEAGSAAQMADAMVRRLGLTWHDVIRLPPDTAADDTADDPAFWAAAVRRCLLRPELLRRGEGEFLVAVQRWTARGKLPSEKQQKWVLDIAARAR